MSTSEIKYVQTTFGKLAYRIDGETEGTPLLLSQRYRGTTDDWDPTFISALASKRRVIRFDSAGVGRSEGEAPESVPEMCSILIAFMDALHLEAVDLLGWSMGGYIALTSALTSPKRFRHIIITGSGPGGVPNSPAPHPHVIEVVLQETISLDDYRFLFFTETPAGISQGKAYIERIGAPVAPLTPYKSAQRQWKAITSFVIGADAVFSRLGEIQLPILVANGVSDVMVPAFNAFAISQAAPNVKLVLYPDAGHGFLFQFAEEFGSEVNAFLDFAA